MPGRLGLLVTLQLIATNVYNSVIGPLERGFSYIEFWMIGVYIPILLGILEYAALLALKRYYWGIETSTKNIAIVSSQDTESKNCSPIFHMKNISYLVKNGGDDSTSDLDVIERRIDKWTCIGSFTFILIFNITYWFNALM